MNTRSGGRFSRPNREPMMNDSQRETPTGNPILNDTPVIRPNVNTIVSGISHRNVITPENTRENNQRCPSRGGEPHTLPNVTMSGSVANSLDLHQQRPDVQNNPQPLLNNINSNIPNVQYPYFQQIYNPSQQFMSFP
ncbi:hypothetical protein JTB14_017955 [Gonioctena quinquepunctata]|nr:hypothetical protein JTB14_017955 [Gonioctena quinquepunctata]